MLRAIRPLLISQSSWGQKQSQVLTFFEHRNFERMAAAEARFIHLEPKFSFFDPMSQA